MRIAPIALLLAASAAAQQTLGPRGPSSGPEIVVLVHDPSGKPVQGVVGWLRTDPPHHLLALPEGLPAHVGLPMPKGQELHATSATNGLLRFAAPSGGALGAGAGWAITAAGLGALLPRLLPGEATRVVLQPLGVVTTATGSEPFTLWARACLPDGDTLTLPPQRGAAVRLPAGDYELWVETEDGWLWQRRQVAAGGVSQLDYELPLQRLAAAADSHLQPAGWPDIELFDTDGRTTLRGAALDAPLVTWLGARAMPPRTVPRPLRGDPLPWPPSPPRAGGMLHLRSESPHGIPELLIALERDASSGYHVLGTAVPQDGSFLLPPPSGDAWLLALAPDRAPTARRWLASTPAAPATTAGLELRVALRDPAGAPAIDVAVDYLPLAGDAAAVAGRSDCTGTARLGRIASPGTLRISDARFANREVPLDQAPAGILTVQLAAGAVIAGRARFADAAPGSAPTAILVTLRDPRGRLRPARRACVTAADGSFAFGGLPAGETFVLFATSTRDHETWSARARIDAGDTEVALELRHEDPDWQPPATTGEGRAAPGQRSTPTRRQ